jgi:hypothetical protein
MASGAAFTAVVFGQVANAQACRSTVLPAWRLPLRRNRLLVGAVGAELAMPAGFLYIPPLAHLLDQTGPPAVGFAVAALAVPAVLVADALQKAVTVRRRFRDGTFGPVSSGPGRATLHDMGRHREGGGRRSIGPGPD